MDKMRYNKPKRMVGSNKDMTWVKPLLKGRETGLFIDKPIQVYRCWFEYLKLCLELEDLGLSLEMIERVKFDKRKVVGFNQYLTEGSTRKSKILFSMDCSYGYQFAFVVNNLSTKCSSTH